MLRSVAPALYGIPSRYIPIREAWETIDYKRVRKKIRQVIGRLNRGASELLAEV